eukprot:13854953-Ditylum_brightwellii.AAC.1
MGGPGSGAGTQLVGLPFVETWVRTCIEEASRSAKPSGHIIYGISSCCTEYSIRCAEQFAKMHASGLDPV